MSVEPPPGPAIPPPESAPQLPRRSSRRGWLIGAATTVGVALVGATASALITSERLDGLFGLFGGSPTPSSTPSSSAEYKTISSLDKSITFDVPVSWAARDGNYDVTTFAGSAVMTGTQVDRSVQFGEDGAYVGASGEFATLAQLAEAPDDVIESFLQSAVEELDWTLEGCVPAAAAPLVKDDWFVDTRVWKDCASIPDSRLWEIAMIPDDRSSLVSIQVLLTPNASADIVEVLLATLVIRKDRLPVGE